MTLPSKLVAQRELDVEIAATEAALLTLRRRRNKLSAISQLPEDIMSLIFIAYKDQLRFERSEAKRWLNVLGVCFEWRRIIYDTARFWATFAYTDLSPYQFSLMLANSKQAPWRVHVSMGDLYRESDHRSYIHFAQQLFAQAKQLTALSISARPYNPKSVEELLKLIAKFTSLQTMKLSSSTGIPVLEVWRITHLPYPFFPSLRSLELVDALIPSDVPPLPSLEHLTVRHTSYGGIPLSWIMGFLRKVPNLQSVVLGKRIVDTEAAAPLATGPDLPISLPKLKYLSVESNDLAAIKLFHCLDQLHTLAHVSVSFSRHALLVRDALAALKGLCTRIMPESQALVLSKMELVINSAQLTLKLGSLRCERFELRIPSGWKVRTLAEVCSSSLPLSSITEVTLAYGDGAILLDPCEGLLSLLEKVKVLHIVHGVPKFMAELLWKPFRNVSQVPEPDNRLLEIVTVTAVDWRAHRYEDATIVGFGESLTKRRQLGFPVRELHIKKCIITEKQVEILRQSVSVVWDGITAG